MITKVLALIIIAASTFAYAQPGLLTEGPTSNLKTADVFAPEMGQSEILAGVATPMGSIESPFGSVTVSGYALNLGYAFGVSPVLAPFVQQSYARFESKFSGGSSTNLGLGDTKIGAKGIFELGDNYLHYSVSYNSALLEKSKSNSDTNENTQGSERPSIGFLGGGGVRLQQIGLGGSFEYKIFQDGEEQYISSGFTTIRKHNAGTGNSFKLYAQLEMNFKLGFSYQSVLIEGYDRKSGIITTAVSKSETSIYSLYSIFPLTASNDLILTVMKPEPKDTNGLTYKYYFLAAILRSTF